MTSGSIDELLVRYLGLLHEYTELRSQLASRQSAMYTNLARANFAAERGFRYGPDHFDGRMQALAKLSVVEVNSSSSSSSSSDKEHVPLFAMVRPKEVKAAEATAEATEEKKNTAKENDKQGEPEKPGSTKKAKKAKDTTKSSAPRDPLQWFGVLAPMALRQVQAEAIEAIDNIIPRLASLSAEMAAVEIDVRRARKKRMRAEKQDKEIKEIKENKEAAV